MADFTLFESSATYIGASTDTKPAYCQNGSRCYEHDTGKWYITYDSGKHWVETSNDNTTVIQGAHDSLNCNANLQVANADNASGNPAFVQLTAGTALAGKFSIDQVTANANEVVVKSITAGSNIIGKFGIDQTTDGTTNKVNANQSTHDNLNCNANIQVNNADVAAGNPVPITKKETITTARGTASAALSDTITPAAESYLKQFIMHLNAVGASGTLTITLDANAGSQYDTVLFSQDMTSVTDVIWILDEEFHLATGDKLVVAWANAGGKTYGYELKYRAA